MLKAGEACSPEPREGLRRARLLLLLLLVQPNVLETAALAVTCENNNQWPLTCEKSQPMVEGFVNY